MHTYTEHRRQLHTLVENISSAIGVGLTGAVKNRSLMVISIGNDVLKEREIGRRTNRKIQQKRQTFTGWERVAGKNKGSDYQNKINRNCDFSENGNFNW